MEQEDSAPGLLWQVESLAQLGRPPNTIGKLVHAALSCVAIWVFEILGWMVRASEVVMAGQMDRPRSVGRHQDTKNVESDR